MAKLKNKDKSSQSFTIVQENKEQAAIAQDTLLDSKVADSMIETIHELKNANEVYVPEINKEPKLTSLANDPLHFQAFHMVIDKVRERMKKRKQEHQADDFVHKNKVLIKYWNQYEFERRQKQHDSYQTNLETAKKRKEILLKYKREKKEIMLQMRTKQKEEEKQRKKINNLVHAWILLITQHKIVKLSSEIYDDRKYISMIKNRKCFLNYRIAFLWQYKKRRYGHDYEERLKRKAIM